MGNKYKLVFNGDTLLLIAGYWERESITRIVDRSKGWVTGGIEDLSAYIEEYYPDVKNLLVTDVEDDIPSEEEFIRLINSKDLQITREKDTPQ